MERKIPQGIIFGILILFLFVRLQSLYGISHTVSAQTVVCFCHNAFRDPQTVCTSNAGQIQAHTIHVGLGLDTFGECQVTPTETPIPTVTTTPTLTPTITPPVSFTPTQTPTPTDTPIPIPTDTPTLVPTLTSTPTLTPTPTLADTPTPMPTITSTPTLSPTLTPTPIPTTTPAPQLLVQNVCNAQIANVLLASVTSGGNSVSHTTQGGSIVTGNAIGISSLSSSACIASVTIITKSSASNTARNVLTGSSSINIATVTNEGSGITVGNSASARVTNTVAGNTNTGNNQANSNTGFSSIFTGLSSLYLTSGIQVNKNVITVTQNGTKNNHVENSQTGFSSQNSATISRN